MTTSSNDLQKQTDFALYDEFVSAFITKLPETVESIYIKKREYDDLENSYKFLVIGKQDEREAIERHAFLVDYAIWSLGNDLVKNANNDITIETEFILDSKYPIKNYEGVIDQAFLLWHHGKKLYS